MAPAGALERLSADDVRALIIGKRLFGVRPDINETWTECIFETRETVFRQGGIVSRGEVAIAPSGITCFRYQDAPDNPHCFIGVIEDGAPVFIETVSGVRFRIDHTDDEVDACKGPPVS